MMRMLTAVTTLLALHPAARVLAVLSLAALAGIVAFIIAPLLTGAAPAEAGYWVCKCNIWGQGTWTYYCTPTFDRWGQPVCW